MAIAGWAVRVALTVISAHLGVLTAAALAWRQRTPPGRAPLHDYDVLVPAHDEQLLIAATVRSLLELDYPPERVHVHVVADNCSDDTARIAREAGADVLEREDRARPGKGPALDWALRQLHRAGSVGDAVVYVDADTIVDAGFLGAVDRQLATGAAVVQGRYAVRHGDSSVVGFRAAAMAARTHVRPLGRTRLGGSAGLHGNGMVFRCDLADTLRWSDHLTEDVELHLDLLLRGTRVAYAPDAVVEAEMPDTLAAARSQHERWERGRLQLLRRYLPELLRRSVAGGPAGRVAYLDAAIDQLTPPLSVVATAATGWGAIAGVRRLLFGGWRASTDLAVAGFTIATIAAHVLTALRLTDAPRSTYRALLAAPRMVAWKVSLWLRVLSGPQPTRWTRTERNALAADLRSGARG